MNSKGSTRPIGGAHELPTATRAVVECGLADGLFPGAVACFVKRDRAWVAAIGSRSLVPTHEAMTLDTIFDLASLTKVLATWPVIMLLIERGVVASDTPLAGVLVEARGTPCAEATIEQLLTHTSGLPPHAGGFRLYFDQRSADEVLRLVLSAPLHSRPGEAVLYSDRGYYLLGVVAERLTGRPLDEVAATEVWSPLGMTDTMFRPSNDLVDRIAPTEVRTDRGGAIRGEVHDPSAHLLGGVAGHAGAFSTCADLATFARAVLAADEGVIAAGPVTSAMVRASLVDRTPHAIGDAHGFAWRSLPELVHGRHWWGHTGYTGTGLWIDPGQQEAAILLTNRVHPGPPKNIHPLREQFVNACCAELGQRHAPEMSR